MFIENVIVPALLDRFLHERERMESVDCASPPDQSGKLEPDGRPALLGKRLEVVEHEAAIVRRIFEWYASGIGVETIVSRLNSEGARGLRGRRWLAGAVRTLPKNDKYRGLSIWGKQTVDRRPGTRQRVMKNGPRDQWHVQERPELRIVPDELWTRVQARITDVRAAYGLKPGESLVKGRNAALYSRHLFSGFLRCGVCRGAITVVSGGDGSPRYGCPRSWKNGRDLCSNRLTIRAKVADEALVSGLRQELRRPETVAYVTALLAAALNAILDQRPTLRAPGRGGASRRAAAAREPRARHRGWWSAVIARGHPTPRGRRSAPGRRTAGAARALGTDCAARHTGPTPDHERHTGRPSRSPAFVLEGRTNVRPA